MTKRALRPIAEGALRTLGDALVRGVEDVAGYAAEAVCGSGVAVQAGELAGLADAADWVVAVLQAD